MNYRSVVAFGTAKKVVDPIEEIQYLQVISEHLIPGRWAEVRGPSERELKATTVLEFLIDEASAKVRCGPPPGQRGRLRSASMGWHLTA